MITKRSKQSDSFHTCASGEKFDHFGRDSASTLEHITGSRRVGDSYFELNNEHVRGRNKLAFSTAISEFYHDSTTVLLG